MVLFFAHELGSLLEPDPRERAIAARIARAFQPRKRADAAPAAELRELSRRRPGAIVSRQSPGERAVARRVARAFQRGRSVGRLPTGERLEQLAERRLGVVRWSR